MRKYFFGEVMRLWAISDRLRFVSFVFSAAVSLLLVAQIFLMANAVSGIGFSEDGMILARAVRNLIERNEISYNLGEPFSGVTSAITALIVGAFAFLLNKFFLNISILSAIAISHALLASAAILIVFIVLIRRSFVFVGFSVILFWALLNIYYLQWLALGLEHSSILFLSSLVLLLCEFGRYRCAFFLLGVFVNIRPEIGIISGAGVVVMAVIEFSRRVFFKTAVFDGGFFRYVGAGYLLYNTSYLIATGRFFPQTVVAKSFFRPDGFAAPFFLHPASYLYSRGVALIAYVTEGAAFQAATFLVFMVSFALSVIVSAVCAFYRREVDLRERSLVFFANLCFFGYICFLFVTDIWSWYVANVILISGICLLCNVYFILGRRQEIRSMSVLSGVVVAMVVFFLATVVSCGARFYQQSVEIVKGLGTWVRVEDEFRGEVSRYLAERSVTIHATSVWMEAAGWQSFFNSLYTFDEVGLTSRASALD